VLTHLYSFANTWAADAVWQGDEHDAYDARDDDGGAQHGGYAFC